YAVEEPVAGPSAPHRRRDDRAAALRPRQLRRSPERPPRLCACCLDARLITTANRHLRALGREQARRLETDPSGRPRDEADTVTEAEIHAATLTRVTTLILARHGETDWNRDGRFQGHADPPLNDRGREQARALASELAGDVLDAVYTSDLLRAHETAQIVAATKGLSVVVDPDLRERDVGEWSGLTLPEIEA